MKLLKVKVGPALNLVRQDLHVEEHLDALDQVLAVFVLEGIFEFVSGLFLEIQLDFL